MASQVISEIEQFCLNFTKGIISNVRLIGRLLENQAIQPAMPTQETTQMTELARRRAAKKKEKQKEEMLEHQDPRKTKENVRGKLLMMIKNNLVMSLLIIGMVKVVLPTFAWTLGDFWAQHETMQKIAGGFIFLLWNFPLLFLLKFSNIFWMNELSTLAYKGSMGRPVLSEPSVFISDIVYSTVQQLLFLIQISLFALIPVTIGVFNIPELVLSAVCYSMYAFEYKWMNMGYEIKRRLDLIDRNFAYHLGFGAPMAIIVLYFESVWVRLTLNTLLFPALILGANDAAEPEELRGRPTYIFYPSEKLTAYFFHLLRKFGFRLVLASLLLLAAVFVLCWLGVPFYLYGELSSLSAMLPVDSLMECVGQLCQSVKEWLQF